MRFSQLATGQRCSTELAFLEMVLRGPDQQTRPSHLGIQLLTLCIMRFHRCLTIKNEPRPSLPSEILCINHSVSSLTLDVSYRRVLSIETNK